MQTEAEIKSIQFQSGRKPPGGTQLQIKKSMLPGRIDAKIKLPEASEYADFGSLQIINGTVTLPVRLAFIAYSRSDADMVNELRNNLLNVGILPWLDTKDLLGGQNWRLFRDKALKEADHCLLFLSKTSVSRIGEFQKEIKLALEEVDRRPETSNFLIPIKIDDCTLPSSLSEYNCIDLSKPDGFKILEKSVRQGS